jgi:hypothetical protein
LNYDPWRTVEHRAAGIQITQKTRYLFFVSLKELFVTFEPLLVFINCPSLVVFVFPFVLIFHTLLL